MPYSLPVPTSLAGWSVKIYDKEVRESPHVTVICGECTWRFNLRTKRSMDPEQAGCKLHKRIEKLISANWALLIKKWDEKYPDNKVASKE